MARGHGTSPAIEAAREPATILVVDDEAAVRAVTRDMPLALGYFVVEAASGPDALRVCQTHPQPNLLLTDVAMPGMNGLELGERVRAMRQAMKILYVSGHVDANTIRERLCDTGAGFLEKPFTVATLMDKMRAALERPRGSGMSPVDRAIE